MTYRRSGAVVASCQRARSSLEALTFLATRAVAPTRPATIRSFLNMAGPLGCAVEDCVVGLAGIEPATSELSALRSNRLSYSPATATMKITAPGSRRPNRGRTRPASRIHLQHGRLISLVNPATEEGSLAQEQWRGDAEAQGPGRPDGPEGPEGRLGRDESDSRSRISGTASSIRRSSALSRVVIASATHCRRAPRSASSASTPAGVSAIRKARPSLGLAERLTKPSDTSSPTVRLML